MATEPGYPTYQSTLQGFVQAASFLEAIVKAPAGDPDKTLTHPQHLFDRGVGELSMAPPLSGRKPRQGPITRESRLGTAKPWEAEAA